MKNQIYKKDLVNRIAEKTGLKKKDINEMMAAFLDVIYEVLEEGGSLQLKNLFTILARTVKGQNKYIAPYQDYVYQEEHKTIKIIPSQNLVNVVKEIKKETTA